MNHCLNNEQFKCENLQQHPTKHKKRPNAINCHIFYSVVFLLQQWTSYFELNLFN